MMLIWELQYEDQRLHFLLFFTRGETEQVLKPGQDWYCSWKVMRSSFNKRKPLKHEQTHDVLLFDLTQCHVDFDVYFCNKLFSEFLHSVILQLLYLWPQCCTPHSPWLHPKSWFWGRHCCITFYFHTDIAIYYVQIWLITEYSSYSTAKSIQHCNCWNARFPLLFAEQVQKASVLAENACFQLQISFLLLFIKFRAQCMIMLILMIKQQ